MRNDLKNDINIKKAVWEKATIVPGNKPEVWRKDLAGAWIRWDQYGNRDKKLGYGWEIDHCKPVSEGGTDDLSNLQPLQWENNCSKGDDYPNWTSDVSSEDGHNVYKTRSWKTTK